MVQRKVKQEKVKLVWNNAKYLKDAPTEAGWYLCKVVDIVNCSEPYEYSEPYYIVAWYDKYFDCDGIPVAWAEIPGCSFEIE